MATTGMTNHRYDRFTDANPRDALCGVGRAEILTTHDVRWVGASAAHGKRGVGREVMRTGCGAKWCANHRRISETEVSNAGSPNSLSDPSSSDRTAGGDWVASPHDRRARLHAGPPEDPADGHRPQEPREGVARSTGQCRSPRLVQPGRGPTRPRVLHRPRGDGGGR